MNYYLFIFCIATNLFLHPAETQPEQKSYFDTKSHLAMLGVVIGSCIQAAPQFFSQLLANITQNKYSSDHNQTLSLVAGGVTLISGLYLWRSNNLWQGENISLRNQTSTNEKSIFDLTKKLSQQSKNVDELQKKLNDALLEKPFLHQNQSSTLRPSHNNEDLDSSAINAFAHLSDQ